MEIYKNIPNAYLWILPNSGHSTPIVYTTEFNSKIDDFFKNPYRKIKEKQDFFEIIDEQILIAFPFRWIVSVVFFVR
jgi:hypothetical protein